MKKSILKKALCFCLAFLFLFGMINVFPIASASAVSDEIYTGNMIQHEKKWQQYYINGGSIAATGCGILSLVNCVGYLTGKTMDVIEVAEWAHSIGGFNVTGADGTYRYDVYPYVTERYGSKYGFAVDCGYDGYGWWSGSSNALLINHLKKGGVAIAHVPNHFIALVGYENGKFHIFESSPSEARGTNYDLGDVWKTQAELATGALCMDWFCLLSATTDDKIDPVISDVTISDMTSYGYTITCKASDNRFVEKVAFATWTRADGEDDINKDYMLAENVKRNKSHFSIKVKISDHNRETEGYITRIYAVDTLGNTCCYEMDPIDIRKDTAEPVISDVQIINMSSSGYTVSCKISDDTGVGKVVFPTWTHAEGQDDLFYDWTNTAVGTKVGDVYLYDVKASEHNNELGLYATHIYAFDYAGKRVCYEINEIKVENVPLNKVVLFADSIFRADGAVIKKVKPNTSVQTALGQFRNETLKVLNKDGSKTDDSAVLLTGMTVNLYDGSSLVDSVTIAVCGDTDGNGTIDSTDCDFVKNLLLGSEDSNEAGKGASDVDGNGMVDSVDYLRIKAHSIGEFDLAA